MPRRRLVLIVNPLGGTRRGRAILDEVRPIFARSDIELDIHETQHSGHAMELATAADLTDSLGVAVIGGDGTVHEVAGGLMRRENPSAIPLGVLPGGTGNALAEHLGHLDPLAAAQRIVEGKTIPLDVVRVTMGDAVEHAVNIVGWGAAVDINRTAERLRWLGTPRYTLAALWEIMRARRRPAKLTLDGLATEDEFLMVLACNTKFTGKGMQLAPRAEISNGKLDVIVVRRATRWQMLQLFRKINDGSHVDLPCVEYYQVRSFALDSPGRELLNLDGELKGQAPLAATVLQGALRIFA